MEGAEEMSSSSYNDLLEKNTDDFAIEQAHYNTAVNMNSTHYHKHYEILYLQQGKRTLHVNELHTYTLTPTNIALLRPNVIHQTVSSEGSRQTRVLINISQDLIARLCQQYTKNIAACFNAPVLDLSHYDIGLLSYLFTELLDNQKTNPLYTEKIKINLAKILLHLSEIYFNTYPENSALIGQTAMERIECVIAYLQENFYNQISLADIADQLHISETHLERIFKQATGVSPYKYLLNIRMVNARRLLDSNSMATSEVAAACGFNSLSSFSRSFKQVYGYSPKQYQMQSKNPIP